MKKTFSRTKRRLLASGGVIAAAPLADPAGGRQAAAQARSRTITFVVVPEPPLLVAAFSSAGMVQLVSPKILEGLVVYDRNLDPRPSLATAWKISASGDEISFTLRPGVKWHDGKPFTSADVKFTIEEVLKKVHPRGRTTFAHVTSVETPDPLTAVLKLSTPSPYIMSALAASESPMVPRHLLEGRDPTKAPFATAPVGTGPFRFDSWQRGSHIVLKRNPDYWNKGRPHFDQMIARFIPDAGARAVALEKGEVDIGGAFPVALDDTVRLSKLPSLKVTSEGYAMIGAMFYFEFNMRDPQFQDVRVRRAIAHAIDRKFLIDNVWFGFADAATGPVSQKLVNSYSDKVPHYPFDPKKAQELLDEAGFPRKDNGIRFTITHEPSPYNERYKRFGEYFKQAMATIGIAVDLKTADAATFLRRIWTDNAYQTTAYGIFNTTDPTIGVQRMYWSKNIRKGVAYSNGSGYSSPDMDRVLEASQTEVDPAKRRELFQKMQVLAMTDLPIIPVVTENFVTIYNRRLQNYEADAEGVYGTFADIRAG